MGKTLVIAEKPSVAGDIARAIGGLKKVGDHYEGDSYIVASAVGHLLELKEPAEYEVKGVNGASPIFRSFLLTLILLRLKSPKPS